MIREVDIYRNKHVEGWNKQLLYTAGCLARTIYDREMESTASQMRLSARDFNLLRNRFMNLLYFFTFQPSTPNRAVSIAIQDAFYDCTTSGICLLTPDGVFPANRVRSHNSICSQFLKNVPMVEASTYPMIKGMLGHRAGVILKDVEFSDVIEELKIRLLNKDEVVACLQWFIMRTSTQSEREIFLNTTKFEHSGSVSHLAEMSSFVDHKKCPFMSTSLPLPRTTLPLYISKRISNFDSLRLLFGNSLSIGDWLAHLCDKFYGRPIVEGETDVTSKQLFTALSNQWPEFTKADRLTIIQALCGCRCVPTRHGMEYPGEAYLSDHIASAFPALPAVVLSQWGLPLKREGAMRTFVSLIL